MAETTAFEREALDILRGIKSELEVIRETLQLAETGEKPLWVQMRAAPPAAASPRSRSA